MTDILDFIPVGNKSKPISREELVMQTGWTDRMVREAISRAKTKHPIVNVGRGYYLVEDPDDPNLKAYIRQETNRIREISKGLRRHKALYRTNKNQETLKI